MNHKLVISGLTVGLLAVGASALYYRGRTIALERDLCELNSIRVSEPAREAVAPAILWGTGQTAAAGVRTEWAPPASAADRLPPPATVASSEDASSPAAPPVRDPAAFWRRGEEWMSALKTNDPALYESIQARREEMKDRAKTAFASATNYFLCRDTTRMSDAEAEEFSLLIMLLEETRALSLKARAELSSDERWQTMSAIRSNVVVLAPLLENERDRELYDMAVAMGQNPTTAVQMVDYVNQITSNTSLRAIFPDLPRGRPPGFGPDGRFGDGRRREGAPPTSSP